MLLNRRETRLCCRCSDIVGPRDTTLATVLGPGLLFAAEVTLHPRDGDQRPDSRPGKGKAPAKLRM